MMLHASHVEEAAKKYGFLQDYTQALQLAKERKRPLLLLLTKEECTWCVRFERRTLGNRSVLEELKHNFVVVIVDKNLQKQSYPAKKFQAPFTPRGFFIDPNDESVLALSNGYMKADDFLAILHKVEKKWRKE